MELKEHKVLVFVPEHNAHGKRDVTGAFLPEAERFLALASGGDIIRFDNRLPFARRREDVLNILRDTEQQGYTSVVFFCHGWRKGMQAGFNLGTANLLADAIQRVVGRSSMTVVPLFCCSTADDAEDEWRDGKGGADSFADALRDSLCMSGAVYCRVWAHTTKGHTTRNPNVMLLEGVGSKAGGIGGRMLADPKTAKWRRLRGLLWGQSDFRLVAPYMSMSDLVDALAPSAEDATTVPIRLPRR